MRETTTYCRGCGRHCDEDGSGFCKACRNAAREDPRNPEPEVGFSRSVDPGAALDKLETALRFQRNGIVPSAEEGIEFILALKTVRAALLAKQ